MSDEEPPVVCTIDRDSEKAERRRKQARQELVPNYIDTEELEDGYRLRFAGADSLMGVAHFVKEERKCCSFADYQIELEPPYDETKLIIRGPEGTKDLFQEFRDKLENPVNNEELS